jgi:lysozyme
MNRMQKGAVGAIAGTALALAVAFIGDWEGLRLNSYRDIVGVWTICYGETKGVGPGQKATKEECDSMFAGSITSHETGMRACLKNPGPTLKDRIVKENAGVEAVHIPTLPYVAFVSLAYNIGPGGFCRSSMPRLINSGDLRAACDALPAFNRAGGRVVQGLVNRRAAERKLCLEGLQ